MKPGKSSSRRARSAIAAVSARRGTASCSETVQKAHASCSFANIVKCRPPHNRDPQFAEQKCCSEWLQRQIELVDPVLIVCLGRIAATALIKDPFRITREHGQWFDVNGRRYMAIYHPSALLRDPSKRPETFVDLKTLQSEIYARCPEVYPDA